MPDKIVTPSAADAALRRMMAASTRVVAFTGAGISTECGVPDFRSPDSPWIRNFPIDFKSFCKSSVVRAEAWRRKFAIDDMFAGAKPGRGHRALAALIATGKLRAIITQNVDGLHQTSGVRPQQLVELHGNGAYAACLGCGSRHELADIRPIFEATGRAPDCACGAPVKSATISFGQALPARVIRAAREAALACDLFLAIGSSLIVYPAADFPAMAKENGAKLVIINREPTRLDAMADLVVRGEIGDVLAPFA